jgi:hypothetical protein
MGRTVTPERDPGNARERTPEETADAALNALVERCRREQEERTPREAWRVHRSALRRWARERRTGRKWPRLILPRERSRPTTNTTRAITDRDHQEGRR